MPNPPRRPVKDRHHYTPRTLLANFVDSNGLLHVISMRNGNRYESVPDAVGLEKHLYTPDLAGQDPNVFEDAFAQFEGEAAPVIRDIIANRALPTDKDRLNTLFNFIAFQAVRIPSMRKTISAPISQTRRIIMDMILWSEERFRSQVKQAGMDADRLSYQQVKADFEQNPDFPVITEEYLQHAMTMMDAMLPLLAERMWAVLWSDRSGEQFIVSDHPVTLMWSDGRIGGFYGPGHGHIETDVTFPLGSSAALIGRFESRLTNAEADTRMVAAINSRTIRYARTFLAGSSDEFLTLAHNNIVTADKVVELIKSDAPDRLSRE